MSVRAASAALLACPVALSLGGCADRAAAPEEIAWGSAAVPTSVPSGEPSTQVPSVAVSQPQSLPISGPESDAVIAAYEEYVIESDRFFDLAIAEAARAGAYAGSAELDAILDGVAMGRIREFDLETPQVLWDEGGIATVGTPIVVSVETTQVSRSAGNALVRACTDFSEVDYLDEAGNPMKPVDTPEFLLEEVSLARRANPLNDDEVRWYVIDRRSEQVNSCV